MQPQLRNRFNPSKEEEEQESVINESNSDREIGSAKETTSVDESVVEKAETEEKKEKPVSRVCASSKIYRNRLLICFLTVSNNSGRR